MRKNIKYKALALTAAVLFLSGCNESVQSEIVNVPKDTYTKMEYESVTVQKGDMQPEFEIGLTQNALVYYNYSVKGTDLELERINVSVGDYVEAGQELVAFKSEELEKKVKELEEQLEQNKLLLEHVKKQKAINVDENNTTDEANVALKESYDTKIKMLEDDIALSEIYLSEGRRELENCRVIAKDSGTITYVSNALTSGVILPDTELITEASGEVSFYAEVKEDYEFNVGDVFLAESPKTECDVRVTDIKDNDGRSLTVYFEPVSADVVYVSGEKFVITIKKESLKDVVYVDEDVINKQKDGRTYVYVLDENGYRRVQYVTVETNANGMAIISEGLVGQEEVTK